MVLIGRLNIHGIIAVEFSCIRCPSQIVADNAPGEFGTGIRAATSFALGHLVPCPVAPGGSFARRLL